MNQGGIEYLFAAFVDVEYIPFVNLVVRTQHIAEDVLIACKLTMIKQIKKEYTVKNNKAIFFKLLAI